MTTRILLVLAALMAATVARSGDADASSRPRNFTGAVAAEAVAKEMVLDDFTVWDGEKLRDLSRKIATFPEPVAVRAVWMVAGAPVRFDTLPVLAAALSSPAPVVRMHAADVIIRAKTPDGHRLLLASLSSESDPTAITHIVSALATQGTIPSVRNMMDIMFEGGGRAPVVAAAAEQLRRLTRSNLPDNAGAWRDWWLDNEHLYQE